MSGTRTWDFAGRHRSFRELHTLTGFPIHALHERLIDRGMSVEEALAEPFPAPLRGESRVRPQPKATKRLVRYAGQ